MKLGKLLRLNVLISLNNILTNCGFPEWLNDYDLKKHYDIDKFNKRYMELLDDFMKPYALNNTEKSEINL